MTSSDKEIRQSNAVGETCENTPISCHLHALPCVSGPPLQHWYHRLSAQRVLTSFPACVTSTRGSHPAQQHMLSGKCKRKGKRQGSVKAADGGMEREVKVEMRPCVTSGYPE